MPVMPAHRILFDFAQQTTSQNKFMTFSPLRNKSGYFTKVMTAIGIAQDNKYPARRLCSFFDRAPVALHACVHYARAVALGDLN